jgi:hypothetical protein
MTYEKQAAHHVHAGAKAGEQEDFVPGDHPLAAGLSSQSLVFQSECVAARMSLHPPAHRDYAPFPRSSGHRAFGVRADSG